MRVGKTRRVCKGGPVIRDGVHRSVLVFLQHRQIEEERSIGAAALQSIAIDRLRFAEMSELMQQTSEIDIGIEMLRIGLERAAVSVAGLLGFRGFEHAAALEAIGA